MNQKVLTLTSYSVYFLIGVIGLIFAPALPQMIEDFGITLAAAGAIFPAKFIGSFAGAFAGGVLSDRLGRKPVVLWGCLLQAAGMALIPSSASWWLVLALFVLIGLGGGFVNTALNALISEVNSHRRGAAMNTLHGIYGVGSLVGPVIVGFVLSQAVSWQTVFRGAAVLWAIFAAIAAVQSYPQVTRKPVHSGEPETSTSMGRVLLHPIFLLLFLVSFIYNGAATGLVGWINTYMDSLNFSLLLGSSMVSLFYLGLTVGRFTCRVYADRVGFSRIILLCALGSAVSYPLAAFASHPAAIASGVFFAGLFFSGLHPTGLAYANTLFPTAAGTTTGLLSMAMSLGATIVPWLIGLLAQWGGFQWGLGLGVILVVGLVAVAVRLLVLERAGQESAREIAG